jgi:excinuclease ABC subunit C
LQRIRDEAHRFAVRYNRKLRSKRTIRSDLASIPGIGPRRQRVLLRRFGSLKGVKEATRDEIARIPGFSETLASRILTYLGR